ncbi:MAG TPA: DUF1003 domain-containing protein [Gemmatimonadaceae bacterium]|nr:DUF1003 domain-containing protein [Gemmatimonadaceae bacterium]
MPDRRSPSRQSSTERRQRAVGTNRAVRALKARHAAGRSPLETAADRLTRIASSGYFLAVHALWFTGWILWNTGLLPGLTPIDPFPFGLLTMIVSLEAIFLAIFVLMAQRREASVAELREEITLQVLMRAEEEVTKTLQLVVGLYPRLGHKLAEDPELDEMMKPLDAESIEQQLTSQIDKADGNSKGARGARTAESAGGAGRAGESPQAPSAPSAP